MRTLVRAVSLFTLGVALFACAAQTSMFGGFEKGVCVPTMSTFYINCSGSVTEVSDGRTVVVDLLQGCYRREPGIGSEASLTGRVALRLVQLELPADPAVAHEAREALAARVLGRKVEILPSPYQDGEGLIGMLLAPLDQGTAQLKAGRASYRDYGAYALDSYSACAYKLAEETARTRGLGMWRRE